MHLYHLIKLIDKILSRVVLFKYFQAHLLYQEVIQNINERFCYTSDDFSQMAFNIRFIVIVIQNKFDINNHYHSFL